jgi:hypothetical protein
MRSLTSSDIGGRPSRLPSRQPQSLLSIDMRSRRAVRNCRRRWRQQRNSLVNKVRCYSAE